MNIYIQTNFFVVFFEDIPRFIIFKNPMSVYKAHKIQIVLKNVKKFTRRKITQVYEVFLKIKSSPTFLSQNKTKHWSKKHH